MTVLEAFESYVKTSPERCALIYEPDERATYARLWDLSGRLYAWLKSKRIGAEDVVMYCLPRGIELYSCILGTLRAGAAFVLTETDNSPVRTEFIRGNCGCKLFVDVDCWNDIMAYEPLEGYEAIKLHNLCYIAYTSGTTGNPKGVLHEYGSLENAWKSVRMNGKLLYSPEDNFLVMSPMNFVSLPIVFAFSCVSGNCVSIMPYRYSESEETMKQYFTSAGVNCGYVTPSFLRKHLPFEHPWRICTLSSEPADGLYIPDLICINCYASTEAGCILAKKQLDGPMSPASVGKSQSDIEVYILDENEMEVGAGKIGEICYRNPYVRGYLNLPEKTRKLLRGRLFHTGDAGSINEQGDLIVHGRLDEMFKISGYRIDPEEVADAVQKVSPLRHIVVRGFVYKDVSAIIVFYTDPITIDPEEMQRKLLEILPEYMIPTNYIRLRDFPLLETGKLDKLSLLPPEGSWDNLRKITSVDLTVIGKGRTATVLSFGDDKILKLLRPSIPFMIVRQEMILTQVAHAAGLYVPDAYEIVRSGASYGIVMDKIEGDDLENVLRMNPSTRNELIYSFTDAVKNLHEITIQDKRVPDIKKTSIALTDHLEDSLFSLEDKTRVKAIFEMIPDAENFVHGDCHPGNVVKTNDKMYFIDLTLCGKGHPIFDHTCMYSHYVFLPSLATEEQCTNQLGMNKEQAEELFNCYLKAYYPNKCEMELTKIMSQIVVVHAARICLASVVLPDVFPEEVIKTAKSRVLQYDESADRGILL